MSRDRVLSRLRTMIQGRIVFNRGCSTMDCVVRDMAEGGARLQVAQAAAVPERFDLVLPLRHETHRAVVRWRREDEIGVAFEAAAGQTSREADPEVLARLQRLEAETANLHRLLAAMQAEMAQLRQGS